jgi:hypothetical protein
VSTHRKLCFRSMLLAVLTACFPTPAALPQESGGDVPTSRPAPPAGRPIEAAGIAAAASAADVILVGRRPEVGWFSPYRSGRPPFECSIAIWPTDFILGWPQQCAIKHDSGWVVLVPTSRSSKRFAVPTTTLPPSDLAGPFLYFVNLTGDGGVAPVQSDAWFAVATEENLRRVREATPQCPAPGASASRDGLELHAVMRTRNVTAGDPILVDLYLVNRGQDTLLVPQHSYVTGYPFTTADGRCFDGDDPTGAPMHFSKYTCRPDLVAEPAAPIPLGPSQWFRETIRLDSWAWDCPLDRPMSSGHRWGGKFIYSTWTLPQGEPTLSKRYGDRLWSGRVDSNPVGFQFVPCTSRPSSEAP